MAKNKLLTKAQKEAVLAWIAEGLQTDEINKRAAVFKPAFKVRRQQVDQYRKSRGQSIKDIVAAGELKALTTGLALKQQRIVLLQAMADKMMEELLDKGLLWTEEVKGIGGEKHFERIDYLEFNSAEVQQLRGVLDDIAKELGHRSPDVKVENTFNFNVDDWKKQRAGRLKQVGKMPSE